MRTKHKNPSAAKQLEKRVLILLDLAEADLGFEWSAGKFQRTGAKVLDKNLVNDQLAWLRQRNAQNVVEPFE